MNIDVGFQYSKAMGWAPDCSVCCLWKVAMDSMLDDDWEDPGSNSLPNQEAHWETLN